MVALSRLKATFVAWKSNFWGLYWTFWPKFENMGSRLAKEWHVVTTPACEAHRATSKDAFATVQSKSKMGLRKMHERGPPQSACPVQAGNLVLKREENKFFREVTVVWAQAYGQGDSLVSLQQVQRWLCGYSPSIQSRSLLGVPCHCSFTQPNTCIRSLAATAADIIMDGLCQELPAYGTPCSCGRCFIQSWQRGSSVIWLPRKSSRVETERG